MDLKIFVFCGIINRRYYFFGLKRVFFERKPQIVAKMQQTIEIATFFELWPITVAALSKSG